ncbi:MAG: DUF1667 domain-containing protein [Erysipelotrichaceae bacterium]|jgi:CxxC motif-containing protein|nr:DUF1667 domain-containing protein [Bacillota bacterium]MDY0118399.1 DUF1667 domain-containing protein [Bacilli bacterium]NLJ32403.1 DUF1667 domain-containing protein [Erysipelotrichaceae bacterium]HOF65004.1 DUF1667 domain-containing protein [Bacilli bacterium]
MAKKTLICIVCPRGCHLEVDENFNVTGNFCKRGIAYAKEELTTPTRTLTSTVIIRGGVIPRLSVKTSAPIPKEKIFEVMEEIRLVKLEAPINVGDIIIKNVANTNVDIVATQTINKQ